MIKTTKNRMPLDGPAKSTILNNFMDQVVEDLISIDNRGVSNEVRIEEIVKILKDEVRFLSRKISSIELSEKEKERINARNGIRISYHQSAYNVDNLLFFQNSALRPIIDSTYGIGHLPINDIESKFTSVSLVDGSVIVPASLRYSVSSSFIDEGSVSATDHESGYESLSEGKITNAFNGVNTSYWIRTVEFPADSDVTEVQCELVVTVPSQNNTYSNMLTIHPYPTAGVDVIDISFSSDLTSAWYKLPVINPPSLSNPYNNSREQKFLFASQDIDQIRIRLRQRNFVIENDRKIFRYGLQDVGLYLCDFEKTSSSLSFSDWSSQSDSDKISCVYRIDAPSNNYFTAINYFSSNPDFSLEESSNRHLVFRIYNGNPISGSGIEIWNSTQSLPQNQGSNLANQITLNGLVSSIYVSVSMRHVDSSGGSHSPFAVNSSPWFKGFTIEYSLSPGL